MSDYKNTQEPAAEEVAATTDNTNGTAAATAEPTLEERLAAAEAKAAENLEGWQRARAEFANARKRFEKLQSDAWTNAAVEIASHLLPVLDDFDLAMANVPEEIAQSEWYGGLRLVPRKLEAILERINIERIPAVGAQFDPHLHNAIMREPSDDFETDTVLRQFQAGYRIGDRVIRPAVVVVAA